MTDHILYFLTQDIHYFGLSLKTTCFLFPFCFVCHPSCAWALLGLCAKACSLWCLEAQVTGWDGTESQVSALSLVELTNSAFIAKILCNLICCLSIYLNRLLVF